MNRLESAPARVARRRLQRVGFTSNRDDLSPPRQKRHEQLGNDVVRIARHAEIFAAHRPGSVRGQEDGPPGRTVGPCLPGRVL